MRSLLVALALLLASAAPAAAQGLREDARGLLSALDEGLAELCDSSVRIRTLLAEVESARAEPHMSAEVSELRELLIRAESSCEPGQNVAAGSADAGTVEVDAGGSADAGPVAVADIGPVAPEETFLDRCERLGREERWCEVLERCAPLLSLDGRYKTLMARAERGCR